MGGHDSGSTQQAWADAAVQPMQPDDVGQQALQDLLAELNAAPYDAPECWQGFQEFDKQQPELARLTARRQDDNQANSMAPAWDHSPTRSGRVASHISPFERYIFAKR